MTAATHEAPPVLAPPLPGLDRARAMLQHLLLVPLLRFVCHPLRVAGPLPRGPGPYVFAANHASHLDAVAVLAALPAALRRRTVVAAAEDYFFTSRWRAFVARLAVGAFPFPRGGPAGVQRTAALLAAGWSVVLFPEGTRSRDGRLGRFRRGIGALAADTAVTVVPVALAGAQRAWPKGACLPRRVPLAVAFGAPLRCSGAAAEPAAAEVEAEVRALHAAAERFRAARRPLLQRAGDLARSPAGLQLAFAWGVAEALVWPVVPDFLVAALAVAAPARALALAAAATAGSVVGGTGAWLLAATPAGTWLLANAPLVTDPMRAQAAEWLTAGPAALLHQPMSGIPFKAFAYQAADLPLPGFVAFTALARGARILGVAALFAAAGLAARRALPRLYTLFLAVYTSSFVLGLSRVVAAWS